MDKFKEEKRKNIHVSSPDGEIKIWLEPDISVSYVVNFSTNEISEVLKIVKNRKDEINAEWEKHFQ